MNRKKNNRRTVPCQFCDYPISQTHHALPFATFGESECTLQLCANCHELYHLLESSYMNACPNSTSEPLRAFILEFGNDDYRIKKAVHFIAAAVNIAAKAEWVRDVIDV